MYIVDPDITIYSMSTNEIEIVIKTYNGIFCKRPSATLPLCNFF